MRSFIKACRTGGTNMTDYKLYYLDGDGRIGRAHLVRADSDDDALVQARKLRPPAHRCELWLKNRLVAKLNAQGSSERIRP